MQSIVKFKVEKMTYAEYKKRYNRVIAYKETFDGKNVEKDEINDSWIVGVFICNNQVMRYCYGDTEQHYNEKYQKEYKAMLRHIVIKNKVKNKNKDIDSLEIGKKDIFKNLQKIKNS